LTVFDTKALSTLATMSKQPSTLSNGRNFNANTRSFDIVAVFGNKVERYFDIVASVDRA